MSLRTDNKFAPVLKWPGACWSIGSWIASFLPETDVYLETCFGSGGALCSRRPSPCEVANDLDDQVVNFFSVLRSEPQALAEALSLTPWSRREWELARVETDEPLSSLERARRFVVAMNQSHGQRPGCHGWRHDGPARGSSVTLQWTALPERIAALAERLRGVQFECRHALDVLERYSGRDVLVFHDPPFLGETRRGRKIYRREMRDPRDHAEILDALRAHPGPVATLHYRNALYDKALASWTRVESPQVAEHGARRTASLYLNPELVRRHDAARQVQLFA